MNKEERVIRLIEELESVFEIRTFLDHDPYKVLVRTILSQRTRDENTDQATNNLFAKYKDIRMSEIFDMFKKHLQKQEMFEEETMRVYSTLGNPNVLGEFLLLVIPVSAVFMIKDKWESISKYVYALKLKFPFELPAWCFIIGRSL